MGSGLGTSPWVGPPGRSVVFTSYSRADIEWLRKLGVHLRPFERDGIITPWDDTRIEAGAEWSKEIEQKLDAARVAVLLVSPNFFFSDFIVKQELPRILQAVKDRGLVVVWMLISESAWEHSPLANLQAGHNTSKPLDTLTPAELNAVLKHIAEQIAAAASQSVAEFQRSPRTAEGQPFATPHTLRDTTLLAVLRRLTTIEFETLVFELDYVDGLPVSVTSSYEERLRTFLLLVEHSGRPPNEVTAKVRELETRRRLGPRLRNWLLSVVSICWGRLYHRWASAGYVAATSDFRLVDEYLAAFFAEMTRRNGSGLRYVPTSAADIADNPLQSSDFDPEGAARWNVQRIRQVLRLLAGTSRGGDQATAQLASLDRASRAVRSAVRVLLRTRQPLILLGDPGTGKSMTLREVGRRIVLRQRNRRYPRVPIYAQLGLYNTVENGRPGDLLTFISQSVYPIHSRFALAIPKLLAERRLIVLFDGMDEMERRSYAERVRTLSDFAAQRAGSVKTLFACRINDFSPEFVHRQMVLLPFDAGQVTEFVRRNLRFPLSVNGDSYNVRTLVKALLENSPIAQLASNPLLLHLICVFVQRNEQWPDSRAALFENYVEVTLGRVAVKLTGNQATLVRVRQGLALLAYKITSQYAGTVGSLWLLEETLGSSLAVETVQFGREAGLLVSNPGNETEMRFSHHRLQEFFTALYLSEPSHEVNWSSLIDIPRWQETLLNLVSLQSADDALAVLQRSIDEVAQGAESAMPFSAARSPRDSGTKLTADEERSMADRLVLAANIVREAGRSSSRLPDGFVAAVENAIPILARTGRPTTQVKTLWAIQSSELVGSLESVDRLLRSEVGWVRDQATLVLGSLTRMQKDSATNIGEQLMLDWGNRDLISRLPLYWKAARADRSGSALRSLTWALAWWALYNAGILTVCALMYLYALARFPVPLISPWTARIAGVALFCTVVPALNRLWRIPHHHGAVYVTTAASILAIFSNGIYDKHFGQRGPAIVRLVAASICAFLLLYILFWICSASAVLVVSAKGGALRLLRLIVSAKTPRSDHRLFGWILGGLLFIGFIGLMLNARYGKVALLLFVCLALAGSLGLFVKEAFGAIKRGRGAFVRQVVLKMGGELLVLTAIGAAAELAIVMLSRVPTQSLLNGLFITLVLIMAVAITFMNWKTIKAVLVIARRRYAPEEWVREIQRSDSHCQNVFLTKTNRHNLGLSTMAFLDVLASVESDIREEPALSSYWKVRHSLEQAVRQERLESDEASSRT
jgi:hypothetical protein